MSKPMLHKKKIHVVNKSLNLVESVRVVNCEAGLGFSNIYGENDKKPT